MYLRGRIYKGHNRKRGSVAKRLNNALGQRLCILPFYLYTFMEMEIYNLSALYKAHQTYSNVLLERIHDMEFVYIFKSQKLF